MTDLATRGEMPLANTQPHPLAMLQSMIDRGADPVALGQMMELARQFRADQAVENYAKAIADFQAQCPAVLKKDKADRYKYASFETIMDAIGDTLRACGLSLQFDSEFTEDGRCKVVCRIRCGVHVECTSVTVPVPKELRVMDPQKAGAALSYAKRYALVLGLNLPIVGEDNENAFRERAEAEMKTLTLDQVNAIEDGLRETNSNRTGFLNWAGVTDIADIPQAKYAEAMRLIDAKRVRS